MEIEEQVSLKNFTTFGIGGPAYFFTRATKLEDLKEALGFAKQKNLKTFFLGGGSNTLFDDAGFNGLVIKIEFSVIELERTSEGSTLTAGAGESWDVLAAYAVEKNLWGIENLSGIPGTVGGAVVQNIGAYGAALSQTLLWAEVVDSETGEVKKIKNAECAFGYRDSIFKHDAGRHIIIRAAFKLRSVSAPELSYKDLAERFKDKEESLSAIRQAVLEIRRGKFPDVSVEGTAGSFFKNPILPADAAEALAKRYPGMPLFPLPESSGIKVPLAWILDHRHGVMDIQNTRVGGARLFEKQPLVIAAQRGCSSHDVQALANEIQKRVRDELHIEIEPEVHVVLAS